ncbi:MAG: hypothetical protein ABJF04_16890 [Reichenbachiella sp.]|uniref:hypothetical protein n=1 Tax=Reichenbachiella sp. TaxID=2184521 RepID=UPI0032647B38
MIWVILVLSILLGVVIWLLFTPITLFIDTLESIYYIKVKGVCKISLNTAQEPISIDINLPIRKFTISSFERRKKYKKETQKGKKAPKSFKAIYQFVNDLIKSFELVKMSLNVDTTDFARNAQLVPVFHFLSGKNRSFSINFDGHTYFQLILKNRLIRILRPAIAVAMK